MMNVIFLDIDGVLNRQNTPADQAISDNTRYGFDPKLVKNLKAIVDKVENAQIVITSSWRFFRVNEIVHPTRNWRNTLDDMLGYDTSVIYGDCYCSNEQAEGAATGRAKDIRAWLNANTHLGIANFVILDDECKNLKKEFPNNVVDCSIKNEALSENRVKDALWIFTN